MTDAEGAAPKRNADGRRAGARWAEVEQAFSLAVGLLTIVSARVTRTDRRTVGQAMALAPFVGACLGLIAGLVAEVAGWLGLTDFIAATLAIGALAVLTGLLHLDGLADTADAVGSRKPAPEALAVMKRPDVGPFGVASVLFVVILQIGALTAAIASGRATAALLLAGAAGRLVLPVACRRGVPAARPSGLGALVAGSVSPLGLVLAAATAVAAGLAAVPLSDLELWRSLVAVALTAGVGWLLLSWLVRRFTGITGDILGALVEATTTVALLTVA
ncbi:MAG TPA: adenosylcobinamide-GDP ribazoletransferase [Actinomycetes bacterium]